VFTRITLIAFAIVLWLASCSVLHAAGGIVFDSLTITNNGAVVLYDDFNDGDISNWSARNDVSIASAQGEISRVSCLCLNWHGKALAGATKRSIIAQPGVTEVVARVCLPPVEEQYNWSRKTVNSADIMLRSGSSKDAMCVSIELYPKEAGYRVSLSWNQCNSSEIKRIESSGPRIAPQTWMEISLRVDPGNRVASLGLNSRHIACLTYDPKRFQSFKSISICGRLGDGQPQPEKPKA
jgi:hypothetical protein